MLRSFSTIDPTIQLASFGSLRRHFWVKERLRLVTVVACRFCRSVNTVIFELLVGLPESRGDVVSVSDESLQRIADYSAKCSYKMIPEGSADYSGIQLRVDSKPSHSVYECSSADTQSDCSAIRTAYAALARGKRLYDFLALLPFVFLSAGVDIRS